MDEGIEGIEGIETIHTKYMETKNGFKFFLWVGGGRSLRSLLNTLKRITRKIQKNSEDKLNLKIITICTLQSL